MGKDPYVFHRWTRAQQHWLHYLSGIAVEKWQVSLALNKDLIKLIDKRGGRASRSAEGEYLIKLDLKHENQHDNEEVKH
jgi:hypothetical protein